MPAGSEPGEEESGWEALLIGKPSDASRAKDNKRRSALHRRAATDGAALLGHLPASFAPGSSVFVYA